MNRVVSVCVVFCVYAFDFPVPWHPAKLWMDFHFFTFENCSFYFWHNDTLSNVCQTFALRVENVCWLTRANCRRAEKYGSLWWKSQCPFTRGQHTEKLEYFLPNVLKIRKYSKIEKILQLFSVLSSGKLALTFSPKILHCYISTCINLQVQEVTWVLRTFFFLGGKN